MAEQGILRRLKGSLSRKKVTTRKSFCIRLLDEEKAVMQKMADSYCNGSLSDWMRLAALKWKPTKEDFAQD